MVLNGSFLCLGIFCFVVPFIQKYISWHNRLIACTFHLQLNLISLLYVYLIISLVKSVSQRRKARTSYETRVGIIFDRYWDFWLKKVNYYFFRFKRYCLSKKFRHNGIMNWYWEGKGVGFLAMYIINKFWLRLYIYSKFIKYIISVMKSSQWTMHLYRIPFLKKTLVVPLRIFCFTLQVNVRQSEIAKEKINSA